MRLFKCTYLSLLLKKKLKTAKSIKKKLKFYCLITKIVLRETDWSRQYQTYLIDFEKDNFLNFEF